MKRLVLVGEGQGDVAALQVLVRRLLREKESGGEVFVDHDVIRESSPVKWDKQAARPDYTKWISRVTVASRRPDLAGVLAVYDGDAPTFPAGSASPFCAGTAAKLMARAAAEAGAGKTFSLATGGLHCRRASSSQPAILNHMARDGWSKTAVRTGHPGIRAR